MFKLNVKTGKSGESCYDAVPVKEQDFWRDFLTYLNLDIRNKEKEILSWILSKNPENSYFSSPHKNELMEAMGGMTAPELTRIKNRLMEMDLVTQRDGLRDKRKKLIFLNESLRNMQRFVKRNNRITLVSAYEITS